MKLRNICSVSLIFLVSVIGYGCGGSGDDTPAVQPLSYVGNESPATITLANAPELLANVISGGDAASSIPVGVSVNSADSNGASAASSYAMSLVKKTLEGIVGNENSGYYLPVAVPIDETVYCSSGYYTMKGNIDELTLTGAVTINYVNCVEDGVTFNGTGTMTIDAIDIYTGALTASVDFTLLEMSGPDYSGAFSGSMWMSISVYGVSSSDSLLLNAVIRDDLVNKMYKYVNYMMDMYIDDIYSTSSSATMSLNGEVYDSDLGGVSIQTVTPLAFSSMLLDNPDSGGPVVMTGNNFSKMQLTVESANHVKLEFDLDGDGSYEIVRYVLWSELDDHENLDLTDTDGDGMHDSWETMNSLNPAADDSADDPDGDGYSNLDEYMNGTDPQDPLSF